MTYTTLTYGRAVPPPMPLLSTKITTCGALPAPPKMILPQVAKSGGVVLDWIEPLC